MESSVLFSLSASCLFMLLSCFIFGPNEKTSVLNVIWSLQCHFCLVPNKMLLSLVSDNCSGLNKKLKDN